MMEKTLGFVLVEAVARRRMQFGEIFTTQKVRGKGPWGDEVCPLVCPAGLVADCGMRF